MIAKGWICLRWGVEFEHHGSYIIGERAGDTIHTRLAERQPRWDYVNRVWMVNHPYAARFYREILQSTSKPLFVEGLVEDGLLEDTIQSSVALFAETLWNPFQNDGDILQTALSPYYQWNR